MGADNVNIKTIEDYLQNRPESLATYKANNGGSWLVNAMANADISNFEYYYDRIKKMTLLRTYNDLGVDISWFYDADNIFDIKKKERQENNLNKYTLNEIADMIDTKILSVRETCVDNVTDDSVLIGDSVFDILEELEQSPEIGVPLYGNYINTITRGARLGKVYMRSAATGVGKLLAVFESNFKLTIGEKTGKLSQKIS
jgi:replicative DNA helicase